MANIYLRVPMYVADFYRHRDEQKPLTEWQPVEFKEFSYEMRLMRSSLTPDGVRKHLTVLCYSERSWKNILQGKLAMGGKSIFFRDKDKWPSTKELLALEGRNPSPNEEHFDYLCIAAPREAVIGSKVVKVDGKFSITPAAAQAFANVLRDEFLHFYYEWCVQEERLFRQKGLTITKAEMMERFYAQYDIRMAAGGVSHNTMRQQAKRLFDRGKAAKMRRTAMQGEYFDYVSSTTQPSE